MQRWFFVSLLLAACTEPATDVEPNQLGITSVETARSGQLFTVQAYGEAGERVAALQLRTGLVAGIRADELVAGSELEVSVGTDTLHLVTREVAGVRVDPNVTTQAVGEFLRLQPVTAALQGEQVFVEAQHASATEIAFADFPEACPASALNTSPVAQQCCSDFHGGSLYSTMFVRPSDRGIVQRMRQAQGRGCVGVSGEACQGNACFYGPNGFSRAVIYFDSSAYVVIQTNYSDENFYSCEEVGGNWTDPPYHEFSDIVGIVPTGQGCPGGNDGAGEWDY